MKTKCSILVKTFHKSRSFLILVALMVGIPIYSFSYDGTLFGGHSGNLTRFRFIQQFSDIDFVQSDLREVFGNNVQILKLFPITENDVDEEDVQVVNDHTTFLQRNFRINEGDVFAYFVKRTTYANNVWGDGWAIYSHFSASQGWLRYLYFFEVR